MTATFLHLGVPTNKEQPNETYLDALGVAITDPSAHPYSYEFLRFDSSTPMPKSIQDNVHAAYKVDNLEAAMEGRELLYGPMGDPGSRIAFIMVDGAVIEVSE